MSTLGGGTLGSGLLKNALANTLGAGVLGSGLLGDAAETQGTPTLAPSGWASSAFGSPGVTVTASFAPTGWASSSFGAPSVINFHHFVTGTGWASSSFGTPAVDNFLQFAYPSGIAPPSGQVSSPTQVFDPTQFVTLTSGVAPSVFPTTHYVADYYQFIDINGYGINTHTVPAPFIAYRVRTIDVPFIVSTYYGTPTVERHDLLPTGWASSSVSSGAAVRLNTRYLTQHSSLQFTLTGTPDVQHSRRYVGAFSTDSLEFGAHEIYNLTRSIEVGPYATNSPPNELGNAAWIRNRNVTLVANSFDSLRFGNYTSTYVTNAARQIIPEGIDSVRWGGTDVSHFVRTIQLDGFDSFTSRHWHVVYNAARVISAPTIGVGAVGIPTDVRNLNRTVGQWSVGDTATFGTAFVAPSVRTLTQFNSYPHLSAYFGTPGVRFAVLPVFPPSVVPEYPLGVQRPDGLFGATVVTGPFIRTIRPNNAIGPEVISNNADVRNRNRVVYPISAVTRDDFGPFTTVENYVRSLTGVGWQSSDFGAHTVADRAQRAYPATLTLPVFSVSHQVRNLSPDPPSLQYLTVGYWDEILTFPMPSIRFPTFYPLGWDSAAYGMATVRSNQILVDRGIVNLDQVGVPWARGPQYLNFDGDGFQDTQEPPRVRVSPHTIYAPFGDQATGQARANHPTANLPNDIGPEVFGVSTVTNRNRTIYPVGASFGRYGEPIMSLRFQYVYPVQIKSLRMGLAVILGVEQYINLDTFNDGILSLAFGTVSVARPPANPAYILPAGTAFTVLGTPTIENLNREILPSGIPHRGNPQQGFTNPWGLPEFGFHRMLVMTGFRSSSFGTHRVEYRIRHVYPDGHDSLSLLEEDIINFRDRMVVKGRRLVLPSTIPSQESVPQPVVV